MWTPVDTGVRNTQIPTYLVGPHVPPRAGPGGSPRELPPSFLPMKARQAPLPTRSQATTDGAPESNGHLL